MSHSSKVEKGRQKRLRGYRIKSGLEELGELDVQPSKLRGLEAGAASQVSDSDAESEGNDVHLSVFGPNWDEWSHVKSTLFSSTATPAEKRQALSFITVWRARQRPQRPLPSYVEATELLFSVICLDEEDLLDDVVLVQSYGGIISRVVHVMTGSFAAGDADTYRKRAKSMDFPEEAVEVRQRVAHGTFPSISELRWVASMLLQYLLFHFWKVQEKEVRVMVRGQKRKRKTTADKKPVETAVPSNSVKDIKDLLATLGSGDDTENENTDDESEETANAQTANVPSAGHLTVIAGWKSIMEV